MRMRAPCVARIRKCVHLAPFLELLAVVFERVRLEPLEADAFQKARRDDAVGVDVVPAQREAAAGDVVDET